MATQKGIVKKTKIEDFENVRKTGLIAIKLRKGDLLKTVREITAQDEAILITKEGKAIRFKESDVRSMGRTAAGVKGITLAKKDQVIDMEVIGKKSADSDKETKNKSQELLIVSENGYGKRTDVSQYRTQKRGGVGIKTAQITAKTGELVSAKILAGAEEYLIIISQKAQVIKINVSGISKMGRATQGVRVIRLDKNDKVASITCV